MDHLPYNLTCQNCSFMLPLFFSLFQVILSLCWSFFMSKSLHGLGVFHGSTTHAWYLHLV
jgi:hypothetical protein